MTVHSSSPHTSGQLRDDCARCAEHAADPFRDLDDTMLHRLVCITQDPARFISEDYTEADLIAAANVLTVMEKCGRLFQASPNTMREYLRNKWRVSV
jgi:hypothetical protein